MTESGAIEVPRRQRVLSVALLVTVVSTAYFWVVEPLVLRYVTARDELQSALLQKQKLSEILRLGTRPAATGDDSTQPVGLVGRDANEALTGLQQMVRQHAERCHVALTGMTGSVAASEKSMKRILIQTQFNASLAALCDLLYALESSPVNLGVERISIRAKGRTPGQAGSLSNETLEVQTDIVGFYAQN